MRNKVNIFLVTVMLLIVGACKTEKFYVDELARQYFGSFKVGSYWVYEDSVGTIDSTWVVSYSDGYLKTKPFPGTVDMHKEEYEYIEIETNSNLPFNSNKYTAEAISTQITQAHYLHNYTNSTGTFPIEFKSIAVFYEDTNLRVTELLNYRVNQFQFPNVLRLQPSYSSYLSEYIIIAPNVGVIEKKTLNNDTPFKIKNYSIK